MIRVEFRGLNDQDKLINDDGPFSLLVNEPWPDRTSRSFIGFRVPFVDSESIVGRRLSMQRRSSAWNGGLTVARKCLEMS